MGGLGGWARRGDFKAVVNGPPYGSGQVQLFNVAKDPGETRDLSKQRPEMLKEAQEAWNRYAEDVGVVLPE
jgi:arylsulfatase A-like enzyme